MNDTTRKIVIAVIIIAVCGGLVAMLKSGQKEPKANEFKEEIRLVKVNKVELGSHPIQVQVNGKLTAANKIDLYSEVNGVLLNANFLEGANFAKGAIIVAIDATELKNNIRSQKSILLNQTASLVSDLKFDFPNEVVAWEHFLAAIDFNKNLPELPIVSDVTFKKYLAGKSLYSTYFSIKSQEARLEKHNIVAPFSGVLSQTSIKKGTLVRAGQKLGEFIQPNAFELEADISLAEAKQVKIGDKVLLTNESGIKKVGKVIRKNGIVNSESQNVKIYISVTGNDLFQGIYMQGLISLKKVENSTYVDRNLLNGSYIYTIEKGQLRNTKVTVLSAINNKVLVTGLNDGALILSESIKGTYNGMKVRY
jgi:multidrug efflux pump subunit AcrA (membrane-fusion protein)